MKINIPNHSTNDFDAFSILAVSEDEVQSIAINPRPNAKLPIIKKRHNDLNDVFKFIWKGNVL